MNRAGPGKHVLVVEDDPVVGALAAALLEAEGLQVESAATAEAARAAVARERFDLVLSDLKVPGTKGLELVVEIMERSPGTPLLLMTAYASVASAVDAMRAGAADYIVKPFDAADLKHRVRKALLMARLQAENRSLRQDLSDSYPVSRIVAVSKAMREVAATVEKLARTDLTVFLLGESGTGKEVLARALHQGGPRADGPFVAVNCAALPRDLIESELFGAARGAFTGADRDRAGRLEAANGGTLFLDEITELPLEAQPKLLRALEERAFERIGETTLRRVDLRVVAAANRDPRALVQQGRFREDLFFRLAVAPLVVPPLRERTGDVAALARHFLRRLAGDEEPPVLSPGALAALESAPWPGNVRELKNVIERAYALHDGGPIEPSDLFLDGWRPAAAPAESDPAPLPVAPAAAPATVPSRIPESGAALDDLIRDILQEALERTSWNQSAAARLLRVPRHILQYRIAKYGIRPPRE